MARFIDRTFEGGLAHAAQCFGSAVAHLVHQGVITDAQANEVIARAAAFSEAIMSLDNTPAKGRA